MSVDLHPSQLGFTRMGHGDAIALNATSGDQYQCYSIPDGGTSNRSQQFPRMVSHKHRSAPCLRLRRFPCAQDHHPMGFPRGRVGEEPRGARDEINPLTLHLIPNHFRLARLHLPPDGQHHQYSDIHRRIVHVSDAEEEGRAGVSPPSPENRRIKIRRIEVDVNIPPTNKNRGGGYVCVYASMYVCICVFI